MLGMVVSYNCGMADRYPDFSSLALSEQEGEDYRVHLIDRGSSVLIIAPHGGRIEPGTSEITKLIAGDECSLYCFEGRKKEHSYRDLHITSHHFDEPQAHSLAADADVVIAIHGRGDDGDTETVFLGGSDTVLRNAVAAALVQAGFKAITDGHKFPGTEPTNICNRGRRRAGVQLELPKSLRDQLRSDRPQMERFAAAIRGVLHLP
jgi:phage replication-related protein YjqB (UPF0714/DUF867 family)